MSRARAVKLPDGPGNLAAFLIRSLRLVGAFIGLATPITPSSTLHLGVGGRDKILALCRHFGAACYVTSAGGRDLYEEEPFADQGIALRFLDRHDARYAQFGHPFVPDGSIMDMLMFQTPQACRALLGDYSLSPPKRAANASGPLPEGCCLTTPAPDAVAP